MNHDKETQKVSVSAVLLLHLNNFTSWAFQSRETVQRSDGRADSTVQISDCYMAKHNISESFKEVCHTGGFCIYYKTSKSKTE